MLKIDYPEIVGFFKREEKTKIHVNYYVKEAAQKIIPCDFSLYIMEKDGEYVFSVYENTKENKKWRLSKEQTFKTEESAWNFVKKWCEKEEEKWRIRVLLND